MLPTDGSIGTYNGRSGSHNHRPDIDIADLDPRERIRAFNSATISKPKLRPQVDKFRRYLAFKADPKDPARQVYAARQLLRCLQTPRLLPADIDTNTLAFEIISGVDPREQVASDTAVWLLDRILHFQYVLKLHGQFQALRGKNNPVEILIKQRLESLAQTDEDRHAIPS